MGNQENVQNHNFASDPSEWPFLTRGIAYYIAKDSNNQVHLMGNILVWYTASISLALYSASLVFYLLRRRRLCFDIDEEEFQKFCQAGEVLLVGVLLLRQNTVPSSLFACLLVQADAVWILCLPHPLSSVKVHHQQNRSLNV